MIDVELLIVAALFLLFGILTVVKPQLYIRFAQWQTRKLWKAEFRPTEATEKRMRILGIVFLLIALFMLYNHLVLGNA